MLIMLSDSIVNVGIGEKTPMEFKMKRITSSLVSQQNSLPL